MSAYTLTSTGQQHIIRDASGLPVATFATGRHGDRESRRVLAGLNHATRHSGAAHLTGLLAHTGLTLLATINSGRHPAALRGPLTVEAPARRLAGG